MNTSSSISRVGPQNAGADDIAFLSAAELASCYASGALSPVEVADALLDRAERVHADLRVISHLDRAATLAMARAAEARWRAGAPLGPLDGMPVTVKDLVAMAGWPLGRGSAAMVGDPPATADAPAVTRLREAGAVFLARTTAPDMGAQIVTRNAVQGVALNPHDRSRSPGGSSGGAAVALATGLGPIALGTDGAGSIRVPAAWTGVFGLKPSFGRVPAYPASVFSPHSVAGPMARTVQDAEALLAVLAQPDPRDAFALQDRYGTGASGRIDLAGLRVGVTPDFGIAGPTVDPDLAAAVLRAAAALEAAGARVEMVEPAWPCPPIEPFQVLWEATYAGFLAVTYPPEKVARMDPLLLAIAERGRSIDMIAYHRALAGRAHLTNAAFSLFQEVDLLLGPVTPCPPPLAADGAPPGCIPGDWSWCPFTYLWNMTGQPAASVPMGLDHRGLPTSVQIVGWIADEAKILAAARALEAAIPPIRAPQSW